MFETVDPGPAGLRVAAKSASVWSLFFRFVLFGSFFFFILGPTLKVWGIFQNWSPGWRLKSSRRESVTGTRAHGGLVFRPVIFVCFYLILVLCQYPELNKFPLQSERREEVKKFALVLGLLDGAPWMWRDERKTRGVRRQTTEKPGVPEKFWEQSFAYSNLKHSFKLLAVTERKTSQFHLFCPWLRCTMYIIFNMRQQLFVQFWAF